MSTATETKEKPELHEITTGYSKIVHTAAGKGEISGDGKHISFKVEASEYEKLLPTELKVGDKVLTQAELAQVDQALTKNRPYVIASVYDAHGTLASEAAKKHAKIETSSLEFHMAGKDRLDTHWTRESQVNAEVAEKGKEAAKKTVYGAMGGKLHLQGTDKGSGELRKVAVRQKAIAEAMFGK